MEDMPNSDPSSLSNITYFKTLHLDWYLDVDFITRTLNCNVILKFECIKDEAKFLVLDTRDLVIEKVEVDSKDVMFKILKEVKPFGSPLEICLPENTCKSGTVFQVSIRYRTSPKATAAQWLPPCQTLGKKHPYMFTQCQAIHARSLIPCQDTPSYKFTYSAEVTVPEVMIALMSAVKGEENIENGKKVCYFQQKIPIPSYLLAIAVGVIEFRSVGPRSKVWCELEMIEACAFEFSEVEQMLKAAESLMGPYVWGQYDILILPPSFPYGGMENPCLTFVTPTVIAGDRSLTSVIAHEITHSWTGNLVTNKKWEDFWLNEGFTRFIERAIVGKLKGEQTRQFMAIGGWYDLIDAVDHFGPLSNLTALVPDLNGIDPDDAFSRIPYEKGSAFLHYIESLVGGPDVFNPFLRSYIDHFKLKTIVTQDFKDYLLQYFKGKSNLSSIDWNAWLYSPGMPPVNIVETYDTTLVTACKNLSDRWMDASLSDLDTFTSDDFLSFTTGQKISFLTNLFQGKVLRATYVKKMAELYDLFSCNISEIRFAFLRLCIKSKWSDSYAHVVNFVIEQGRLKYVRPLYRELYQHEEFRELAVETYKKNRHLYHSITSIMLAKDLHLDE